MGFPEVTLFEGSLNGPNRAVADFAPGAGAGLPAFDGPSLGTMTAASQARSRVAMRRDFIVKVKKSCSN